jgi:integrase
MRPIVKLPGLIKRTYANRAGETWIGYYFQAGRGDGGTRPKPVALGHHLVKGRGPHTPPPEVLAAYGKLARVDVRAATGPGTVQAVYDAWHRWAQLEVKADRLSRRSLKDYEQHWSDLAGMFADGRIEALTQPVLLDYFDQRTSKDRGKREVAFLGLLCAWARGRGYMHAANPVDRGLRHQLKVDKRPKAPTVGADTYWVVWQCADQLVRDALDVTLIMGTRVNEALRVPMPAPDDTEIEAPQPKTRKSGRASKMVPITPQLQALIERRRALHPHSLYLLFDEKGQQLRPTGAIRSRLYKARDLAKQVCQAAGINWIDFTRQQLRPTAVTQVDKSHGRDEARKLAGHATDRQTAHYVRHEAERVTPAALPAPNIELQARIEAIKVQLASR